MPGGHVDTVENVSLTFKVSVCFGVFDLEVLIDALSYCSLLVRSGC